MSIKLINRKEVDDLGVTFIEEYEVKIEEDTFRVVLDDNDFGVVYNGEIIWDYLVDGLTFTSPEKYEIFEKVYNEFKKQ